MQVDDHHDRHVERGTGQSETWISGYRVASATGVRCVCDALDSLIAEGTRDPLPPAKDCTWNVLFSCTNCHEKFQFSYRA